MEWEYLLIRYGEIFLKGKNRPLFEKKLKENIHKITGFRKVRMLRGRFVGDYFAEHNKLKKVFGLVSYSPAVKVEKDLEKIKAKSLEMLEGKSGTFKILPKRSDKRFPLTSPELNVVLGRYIEEKTALKFEGINPQYNLGIEINQEGAYLFLEVVPCFGGLPAGVEGRVAVLIEDEAGILAGLLLMKRGCDIFPVAFNEKDISLLQTFSPVELKLRIFKNVLEIEKFARENKMEVLVSGQVFDDYKKIDTTLTVFRPLIAHSKGDINSELEKFKSR